MDNGIPIEAPGHFLGCHDMDDIASSTGVHGGLVSPQVGYGPVFPDRVLAFFSTHMKTVHS